jgi:phytoene dehydrogenase-like protein
MALDSHHSHVIVIGGGVAGLAAGIGAARAGASVRLLEGHGLGGRARTAEQHGYLLNMGPHALYLNGALAKLLDSFGGMPAGGNPLASGPRAWRNEAFEVLPGDAASLMRTHLLSSGSKVRFAKLFAELPRLDPTKLVGRSLAEWLDGRPDDIQAVVGSIIRLTSYTDAPDTFDAGAAIAQAQLGLRGVIYPDGGWRSIVESLRSEFERLGGVIDDHQVVTAVCEAGTRTVIATADGEWTTHSLVVANGGPAAVAALVGGSVPGAENLGPIVEAACLDLGTTRPPEHSIVLGIDQPLYLSVHGPVAKLAPPGRTLTSMIKYLPPGDTTSTAPDNRAAIEVLRAASGLDASVTEHERFLSRLTVYHGVPTAAGGGMSGRPSIDALATAERPSWFIAGDWVGGVGMLADASAASGLAAGTAAGVIAGRMGS